MNTDYKILWEILIDGEMPGPDHYNNGEIRKIL